MARDESQSKSKSAEEPLAAPSSTVTVLRLTWVALHLLAPIYAVYWGMDAQSTGLSVMHYRVLMGTFWLVGLMLFWMLVLLYFSLPHTLTGMLGLLAAPAVMVATGSWLGHGFDGANYITECGVLYTLTIGLGFTGVVLLGRFVSKKKGLGLVATLAQGLFIVPFAGALYVMLLHVYNSHPGVESGRMLGLLAFGVGLVLDTVGAFRKILAKSVFAESSAERR